MHIQQSHGYWEVQSLICILLQGNADQDVCWINHYKTNVIMKNKLSVSYLLNRISAYIHETLITTQAHLLPHYSSNTWDCLFVISMFCLLVHKDICHNLTLTTAVHRNICNRNDVTDHVVYTF